MKITKKIILASTSPRRKELLAETGLVFDVVASNYEEDMSLPLPPGELAAFLSKGKALSVAEKYLDAIIIAADTFIAYQDKIFGKPHTEKRAREMLETLSGKTHSVFTGYTIFDTKTQKVISKSVEAKVTFKKLSSKEIEDYIATAEPLERGGAYAIQTVGNTFIEKFEGDYKTIIGLPVDEILKILKESEIF